MNTHFEHRITIPLQDIDAAGVVFFAHLFRYAHEAYEQFMRQLGEPLEQIISAGHYRLPLVHAEADYQRPVRHGEILLIRLQVTELAAKRFTLSYHCVDRDGELRARLRTVHVASRVDDLTACPLPQRLHAALAAHLTPALH